MKNIECISTKTSINKVKLPTKSNFYGYCNVHNYEPLTDIFATLVHAVNTAANINNFREVITKLRTDINNSNNYKYHTELALVVNLLSWDYYNNPQTEDFAQVLVDEYYKICDDFYEIYKNNKKAKDYFWELTD